MAIAMLVAGPNAPEPIVGPEVAARLAELGISRISLLEDPSGVGVVLEGWAFDPARIDDAVLAIFPVSSDRVRVLHEVELVAVAGASSAARGAPAPLGLRVQGRKGVDDSHP
jgi:hypothetical protein